LFFFLILKIHASIRPDCADSQLRCLRRSSIDHVPIRRKPLCKPANSSAETLQ
jgi:hypothetical protein